MTAKDNKTNESTTEDRGEKTSVSSPLKDGASVLANYRNITDGAELMEQIEEATIAAAFFDPQYRGVLDKLGFGNEETRGKEAARSALSQMPQEMIIAFIKEIERTLRPSGHLFLWVDKFHLCQGVGEWFEDTSFEIVDMVVWDKERMGMGYRTRRRCEYLIVAQKPPKRAKDVWTDHGIPDMWGEKVDKVHPHSKPIGLQERLIRAVTQEGDWVLDPASGGYSVFEACRACGRNFIGGDIEFGDVPEGVL